MTSVSDKALGGTGEPLQFTRASALRSRVQFTTPRALRSIGAAAALAQFGLLLWIAIYVYSHSDLSQDFYVFEQARYMIAHGNLDPSTTARAFYYWQNHGEFIMWPLALLSRVTIDNGFFLLLLQAASTAGASYVAVSWLVEVWERRESSWSKLATATVICVVVVLFINPWFYLSDAYDFHFQAIDGLLFLFAARALDRETPRILLLWVPLLLLTGDVATTYVIALGVSAVIVARHRGHSLRPALWVLGAGILWTIVLSAIDANQGSGLTMFYGYLATGANETGSTAAYYHAMTNSGTAQTLAGPTMGQIVKGMLLHPARALGVLHYSFANDWANIAAPGVLGIFSVWTLPLVIVVEASYSLIGVLHGVPWSRPSFQSLPMYAMVTVGGGFVMLRAITNSRRWVRIGMTVVGLLAVGQSVAWAVVITPNLKDQWNTVSAEGSTALAEAKLVIPTDAEVIAQEGVVGAFADHRYVYFYDGPPKGLQRTHTVIPVNTRSVYLVAATLQGQETPSTGADQFVAQAAAQPGARVVYADPKTGVIVVHWTVPSGKGKFVVRPGKVLPAWLLPTAVGTLVRPTEDSTRWHLHDPGTQQGYVVFGDYYHLLRGDYVMRVRLSSSGPVNVEVWNDSTGELIGRVVTHSSRPITLRIPFALKHTPPQPLFHGHSVFHYTPIPRDPGNAIEIRFWAPKGVSANAYSVGIVQRG